MTEGRGPQAEEVWMSEAWDFGCKFKAFCACFQHLTPSHTSMRDVGLLTSTHRCPTTTPKSPCVHPDSHIYPCQPAFSHMPPHTLTFSHMPPHTLTLHPTYPPRLTHPPTHIPWCAGNSLDQLGRADCAHPFPTSCSVMLAKVGVFTPRKLANPAFTHSPSHMTT